MIRDIFTKNRKHKYATMPTAAARNDVPEGIMTKCPECRHIVLTKDLLKDNKVCTPCNYHYKMTAHERVSLPFFCLRLAVYLPGSARILRHLCTMLVT